jgi:hypothetical protein
MWPETYTGPVTSGREFKVIGGEELGSGIDD